MDTGGEPPGGRPEEPRWLPPQSPGGPPAPAVPPPVPPPGYTPPPGYGWSQPPPQPPAQLAGWGSRAWAATVDFFIRLGMFAVLFLLGFFVFIGAGDAAEVAIIVVGVLVFVVVSLLYAPLLMARAGRRNGQTLGHQAAGIRAVRDDGTPMSVGWGMFREVAVKAILIEGVGGVLFSVPTLVCYLWPLWDDQNRAVHDMICSTHVIKA